MALTEKQLAREWALREIIDLISEVQHGRTIAFAHSSNRFAADRKKKMIDNEINNIKWQLINRWAKLGERLGEL